MSAIVPVGAAEPDWAPLDRPGPTLQVDRQKLRDSLTCSEGIRGAEVEPVLRFG